MIFFKYALFFLALPSISTAAPVVNDDGHQDSHSVENKANSLLDKGGPEAGALYILEKKDEIPDKIPVIFLAEVFDDSKERNPIPGEYYVVELVENKKVDYTKPGVYRSHGHVQPALHYFGNKELSINVLGTKLIDFSIKLSLQKVNIKDIRGKPLASVTDSGWESLKAILYHQESPRTGFLYILKTKNKVSVQIPFICLGEVPGKHGQFFAVELVKISSVNVKQLWHDQSKPQILQPVERYFSQAINHEVLDGTRLHEFLVKLYLQQVNQNDVDKVPLAKVKDGRCEVLQSDGDAVCRQIHGMSSNDAKT